MAERDAYLEKRILELENENKKLRREHQDVMAFRDFSHALCERLHSENDEDRLFQAIKDVSQESPYDLFLFTKEQASDFLSIEHIASAEHPPEKNNISLNAFGLDQSVSIYDSSVLQSVFNDSETMQYDVANFLYNVLPAFSASLLVKNHGYEDISGIITPIQENDTVTRALSLLRIPHGDHYTKEVQQIGRYVSASLEDMKYRKEVHSYEEERLLNKQQLDAITQVLPLMYTVVDSDYNIVSASNKFTESFTDGSPQEIRGKKCYEIYKGYDDACPGCSVTKTLATGEIATRETTSYEIEQTGRRFNIYAVPIKSSNGSIERVIELTLETSGFIQTEMRYKRLLENMDEVFWIQEDGIDKNREPHHEILYMNPAFERLTGHSVEELYQNNSLFKEIMLHPEDRTVPRIDEIAQGEQNTHEFRIIRSDGTLRYLRSKIYREQESKGITRTYGLAHDITDIKEAEETINDAYKQYTRLIENAPIGIIAANVDDASITSINEAFVQMLGYTHEEAHQMTPTDFHPEDIRDEVMKSFERVISLGHDRHSFEMVHKDGHTVYTDLSAMYDDISQQVTAYVIDVSERVKEHKEYEKEQKILRHDLKNPISGIMSISQSLLTDATELSQLQQEYWVATNMAATKAYTILENTILSHRISTGTQELAMQPFDVEELVNNLYDTEFKYIAEDQGISFQAHYDRLNENTPVTYRGDEHLFDRLLSNLFSNAFSASQRNDTVSFSASDNQESLYLRVHNTRPLPHNLRDSFFEATGTTNNHYTGEGLGKEIIQNIVALHEGTISYESDESIGTIFYLNFPKKT